MPDDAYEFLGPDLLAPPPVAPGNPPAEGGPGAADQAPANELVQTSAAEKFQVQPAAPSPKKRKKSASKDDGSKEAPSKRSKEKPSPTSAESDSTPSLGALKCQMVFSAMAVIASVGLTILVLVDGLL